MSMDDSFDVHTASTLYWKTVPVLVKQPDREETVEDLSIRILTGVSRHNHNFRVRSNKSNAQTLNSSCFGGSPRSPTAQINALVLKTVRHRKSEIPPSRSILMPRLSIAL